MLINKTFNYFTGLGKHFLYGNYNAIFSQNSMHSNLQSVYVVHVRRKIKFEPKTTLRTTLINFSINYQKQKFNLRICFPFKSKEIIQLYFADGVLSKYLGVLRKSVKWLVTFRKGNQTKLKSFSCFFFLRSFISFSLQCSAPYGYILIYVFVLVV